MSRHRSTERRRKLVCGAGRRDPLSSGLSARERICIQLALYTSRRINEKEEAFILVSPYHSLGEGGSG